MREPLSYPSRKHPERDLRRDRNIAAPSACPERAPSFYPAHRQYAHPRMHPICSPPKPEQHSYFAALEVLSAGRSAAALNRAFHQSNFLAEAQSFIPWQARKKRDERIASLFLCGLLDNAGRREEEHQHHDRRDIANHDDVHFLAAERLAAPLHLVDDFVGRHNPADQYRGQ